MNCIHIHTGGMDKDIVNYIHNVPVEPVYPSWKSDDNGFLPPICPHLQFALESVNIIHNKAKASRLMSLGALFLFLPVWEQHGVYIGVVKVRPAGQLYVLGVPGDLGQAGPGPVL